MRVNIKRSTKSFFALALAIFGLFLGVGCGGQQITGTATVTYVKPEGTGHYNEIGIGFMAQDCGFLPTSNPFVESCHKAQKLKPGESYSYSYKAKHTDRKLYVSCDTVSKLSIDNIITRAAGRVDTNDGWTHEVKVIDRQHVTITTKDENGQIVEKETKNLEDCKL